MYTLNAIRLALSATVYAGAITVPNGMVKDIYAQLNAQGVTSISYLINSERPTVTTISWLPCQDCQEATLKTQPSVTGCGGQASLTPDSNDTQGTLAPTQTTAACAVAFAVKKTNKPYCQVIDETLGVFIPVKSTTLGFTLLGMTNIGDIVSYRCWD